MKDKEISKQLSTFEGSYLSGFFMNNPSMLPTMALLFEKIYLPNQLEMVIEFSKRYRIETREEPKIKMKFTEVTDEMEIENNPLEDLTPQQQKTAQQYLIMAHSFCVQNHELFPTVFETDMLVNNEVFKTTLIKQGKPGEKNTYNVKLNPIQVTLDGLEVLDNRIKRGSVPIIGVDDFKINQINLNKIPDKSIAALMAMQSIEMFLPSMQKIEPQLILEMRDKLSDHLPQFWSAMLKFSKDGKKIITQSQNLEEAIYECQNIVDTSIRPVLIDLNEKIIREKKNWFYRVLSPVGDKVKFLVGKPSLTNLDLLTSSMALATDVGIDYVQHKRKLNELKEEAGLTYLIKLGKEIKKNGS